MGQHHSHFWTYDTVTDEHCRDCGCAWNAEAASVPCTATEVTEKQDDSATVHVAHAVSRRGGSTSYRARAFVAHKGVRHTQVIAIGDTAEEATNGALAYVADQYRRDQLAPPAQHIDHGRIRGAFLDAYLFGYHD